MSPAERIIREYGAKVAAIAKEECLRDCQYWGEVSPTEHVIVVCPEHLHFIDLVTTTPVL